MKHKIITALLLGCLYCAKAQITDTTVLQPLELTAVRAGDKIPVAKTTLNKKQISKLNTGIDIPVLLNFTPSAITNSDAGNGIGYTGIRIRGTDASRINVTLNNIPYNDAESQGTFFVNLPDIISSASSVQIQRGAGNSTNGTGAFGASINISTNEPVLKRGFEINNNMGSFGSMKNTLIAHSGLFANRFTLDGRISNVKSEGYIDRAFSRLQSWYISPAYLTAKTSVRVNIFSGREKTYQAWYGIREDILKKNRQFNPAGMEKNTEPYENETDNYTQTHYQLFINHQLSKYFKLNITSFLTRGKGYYEQYKADQQYADYNLPDYNNGGITSSKTDLIRQLWLDNFFYGNILSLNFKKNNTVIDIGFNWNHYNGKHYGKIAGMSLPVYYAANFKYYNLNAVKKEWAGYAKWSETIGRFTTFVDLQIRNVNYNMNGFRGNPQLLVNSNNTFFNPKVGITYTSGKWQVFTSISRASKEPNRDDFETGAKNKPTPEYLTDWEAGINYTTQKSKSQLNFFYMHYKNQLILTGKINDVGAYTRTNVPESYRAGIEAETQHKIGDKWSINSNIAISANRAINFREYIDDYDNGTQIINNYSRTQLAFSPSFIAATLITFSPLKNLDVSLNTKYVSKQYLDNTSNERRKLNSYLVHDANVQYQYNKEGKVKATIFVTVYNILSRKYEPNGYTFSYYSNMELTTENYYFPMAPINFMAGVNLTF